MTIYQYQSTGGSLIGFEGETTPNILTIPAPGGILTGPVDALRNLVSSSTTFQNWVGAVDQPTAKLSVYVQARSAKGTLAYEPPFALISIPAGAITTGIETGSFNKGPLFLMFFDDVPANYADNPNNVFNWFGGNIEGVVADMWNIAGTGSSNTLFMTACDLTTPPQRADFDEPIDYMECAFEIRFGAG